MLKIGRFFTTYCLVDLHKANVLVSSQTKKEGGKPDAGLLCKVPKKEGNEECQGY
jgi:hypothetical protein